MARLPSIIPVVGSWATCAGVPVATASALAVGDSEVKMISVGEGLGSAATPVPVGEIFCPDVPVGVGVCVGTGFVGVTGWVGLSRATYLR